MAAAHPPVLPRPLPERLEPGDRRHRLHRLARDRRLHLTVALEDDALVDEQARRDDVAAHAAGRVDLDRALGAHVADDVPLDDDRPGSVAAALQTLLEDPARARMMGAAGRQRARSVFTPEQHAGRVEAVYRVALARVAPAAAGARG